jgi:hypothetical protein
MRVVEAATEIRAVRRLDRIRKDFEHGAPYGESKGMEVSHCPLFLHTWCSSLLSNVYIPKLLLDLSSAPLSFCEFGTIRATVAKRRCFRERRQRQVFSCLSADKSEDCHGKKTFNPVH